MSVQIVLKLGDIKGESIVEGHIGDIDVVSWSWGITQTGSSHIGSGGGAGAADVHDLTITKYVDKASPNIASFCYTGAPVPKETILTCIKVGGGSPDKQNKVEFVKITMGGTVMISSFSPAGAGSDERFTETITIHFSQVQYEYTTQKADNTKGETIPSKLIKVGT
jgi:type VI secretion system secreted protein Hcp